MVPCGLILINGWMDGWLHFSVIILVFLSMCLHVCVYVCVCVIMPVCPSVMFSYSRSLSFVGLDVSYCS